MMCSAIRAPRIAVVHSFLHHINSAGRGLDDEGDSVETRKATAKLHLQVSTGSVDCCDTDRNEFVDWKFHIGFVREFVSQVSVFEVGLNPTLHTLPSLTR